MRILIIENDITLSKTLTQKLTEYNYKNDVVENIKDAEYYLDIRNYNIVLIDWMIIDENSIKLIEDIKTTFPKTIVIILSNKNDDDSEIEAFEAGADDYIKKPFSPDVLIARINARLKSNKDDILKIGDLIINPIEERVIYKEFEVSITGKPFEVLNHLANYPDQIMSKEELLHALWEEPELVTPTVIDVAINQIRQKVDKPCRITTIETINRRGYRFCFK